MFASAFGLRDPDRRFAPSGMTALGFFSVALIRKENVGLAAKSSRRRFARTLRVNGRGFELTLHAIPQGAFGPLGDGAPGRIRKPDHLVRCKDPNTSVQKSH